MNRAWIPAGALAGVSVAGLIALGPLTSSLSTPVKFLPAVSVESSASAPSASPVALNVNEGTVGRNTVKPAVSLTRGGQAGATSTSGDQGLVGFKRIPSTSTSTAPAAINPAPSPPPAPSAPPKKAVKRKSSIGADSGPNGDTGLAGGASGGSTSTGAQSGTPGSATP
jgi:hypothetical protein